MPRKKVPKDTLAAAPQVYEHRESSPTVQTGNDSTLPLSSFCSSLQEFSESLAKLVEASYLAFIPELCSFDFQFAPHATFLVDLSKLPSLAQTLPKKAGVSSSQSNGPNGREKEPDLYLVSAAGVMSLADIEADRVAKQKAVARAIVNAVQEVDGYKYANARQHPLKEEEGVRIAFTCNDSQQNKDRAANTKEGRASEAANQGSEEIEGGEEGKRKRPKSRLPTYDCKGAVNVKFSTKSQVLEVKYRHLMVHRETAWRSRGKQIVSKQDAETLKTKRRKMKEGGKSGTGTATAEANAVAGTKKRKRKTKEELGRIKAREQGEMNGDESQPLASGRPPVASADGRNLDTLAELLRADIDNMNQEAAATAGDADNGRATDGTASENEHKTKAARSREGCLACRKRKIKVCDSDQRLLTAKSTTRSKVLRIVMAVRSNQTKLPKVSGREAELRMARETSSQTCETSTSHSSNRENDRGSVKGCCVL